MGDVKVFLVEDHPVVREGTRRLLELYDGIRVIGEADNLVDALHGVRRTSPNVVLMDIKLPGPDGIEATRQLITRDPHLRVVTLSAFCEEYLGRAIEAGACGYVLKNATQTELVRAVLQAASGQSPIDPFLTGSLVSQFARMAGLHLADGLSDRQREVLRMIDGGYTSKQIRSHLSVSDSTLKKDLGKIFDLPDVDNRVQAALEAHKRSLL